MKKYILIYMLLSQFKANAFDIDIMPTNGWDKFNGNISGMNIEITPIGLHARIDLTFMINVDTTKQSYYSYRNLTYLDQNLEAQLTFSLPSSAYFYDSYLWLNPNIIIRAKHMGSFEANRIYNSIVKRKTDPSILEKYYGDYYSLKVFPISSTFSRQVKMSYSIPLIPSSQNKEYVELPIDIIKMVEDENINVTVYHNESIDVTTTLFPLTAISTKNNIEYKKFEISKKKILDNKNAYIEFINANSNPIQFNTQRIDSNEGYYEMRVFTSAISNLIDNTSIYNLKIPFESNGFAYQQYNSNSSLLQKDKVYYEAGKTYGKVNFDDSLTFNYKVNNIMNTIKLPIKSIDTNPFLFQNWTHIFCNQTTTSNFTVETALKNRVLATNTSFLALENGDTVSSTKGNTITNGGGSISSINDNITLSGISIFPNPIIDKFTIKSEEKINSIKIFDLTGKLIYELEDKNKVLELELNADELKLNKGVYIIQIETKNGVTSDRLIIE